MQSVPDHARQRAHQPIVVISAELPGTIAVEPASWPASIPVSGGPPSGGPPSDGPPSDGPPSARPPSDGPASGSPAASRAPESSAPPSLDASAPPPSRRTTIGDVQPAPTARSTGTSARAESRCG